MSGNLVHKIANIPEGFRDFCDKRTLWVLTGFSSFYFLITCAIASKRMLWNDELFTLYISRLGGLSDILAALSTGADQNPPSFYLLTQGVLKWLGEIQLAIRLPEVAGVLVMSLCLYRFVSKRFSSLYGMVAMVFPLITIAYEYAYEARPYGLVLGFSGLALLCWQEAIESPKRFWWLIGLAASGASATASHYYAVFLLIPLGGGEIVRSIMRQRIDFPIWASLGGIIIPLALFFPIILEASGYSHHFWARPEWHLILGFYYSLMIPAIGPILATLIAYSLWPENELTKAQSSSPPSLMFPWHEMAAAIGFVAIPVVAVVLGKLVIGAFTFRYALPAVIGLSILWAIAMYRIDRGRAILGTCFTLFACIWFMMAAVAQFKHQTVMMTSWSKNYDFLQSNVDATLPIVAADLHTFMTVSHYAPSSVSSRIVYLADPQASLRYLGHDTVDRGILDLKPWFQVAVEEYETYIGSHERFLVFLEVQGERNWLGYYWGRPWALSWLLYDLPRASVQIELMRRNENSLLFLVTAHREDRSVRADVVDSSMAWDDQVPRALYDPVQ